MANRAFDGWFNNISKRPALAVALSILWLVLISGVAFFWHLGSLGLIDETEPLFAEASRQMLVTGDWITPFFNGETRFDKPALIYWCQAIAYSIFGVNEWAVRLPSALAALGLISLALYTIQWYLAKEDYLEQKVRPTRRWLTAALGAAIMALNPEMIVWGRAGVSDMLLVGCMDSALLCFFLGYAQPSQSQVKARWYLAFYILIAGAILTKGPVGIVLPALIIAIFLLYVGKAKEVLREMRPVTGLLITLCLSLPWYVLVIWRNGENYINSFFGYHNVERFTSVVNSHSAPWYFYFIIVLLGFAPYSVYLPLAMARLKFWQRNYWRSQERSSQLGLFAFFWFITIFGFFTIAVTKLPSYVLPLMPAAAILVALLWSDIIKDKRNFSFGDASANADMGAFPVSTSSRTPLLFTGWVNVALLSALAVAMFYVPQLIKDPAAPNFHQLIEQSGLTVLGGVIWLLCAVVLAALLVRRRYQPVLMVNVLGFAAFMVFVLTPCLFLIDQERQLPLRELSAIAVQAQKPSEELVMVGFKKPTVVFYTRRPVTYVKVSSVAGKYIQDKAAKKAQPASVLVLAQPKKFPEMGLKRSDYENLGTSGAYELIRVPFKNG
ncbi:glycosyl transferase family protein [Scytonema sp. HK-05]|uniref:ArnT family glycosyltransferase n=1 Tax=Scytonema sp. HK-05 TaxID=1137095 RepID=UPI00093685D4|nr:glycosyltransferase family 39 protein [Scytonema sp. HK-05]OKH55393.1 glycosyltransferase [Scytonema sp. HK-05]BAY47191.1 glycosyl transferase family protein [Scytonema sp. HK-05]